jgi:hypothetical protein
MVGDRETVDIFPVTKTVAVALLFVVVAVVAVSAAVASQTQRNAQLSPSHLFPSIVAKSGSLFYP